MPHPEATSSLTFPSRLQLRLDWSELDLLGHINNVMYFKYLQAARVAYGELLGLQPETAGGEGYILAATQCSFLKPLFFPGTITVRTSVEFMKRTSFGLCHQIVNEQGEVAAEGHDVVVLYHFKENRKMEITAELRKKVEELEGKTYPLPPAE